MKIELPTLPLFGSTNSTNWFLLLLIMLMPLRNIQIQYLPNYGAGLNVINILFMLALLHALISGNKERVNITINRSLIIYMLYSLVALLIGYNFLGDTAAGNWNHLKDELIPILLVFIIQKSATDMIQWRRIAFAALISIVYCFRLVWSQYQSVSQWHYSDDLRIRGPFMDLGANEMGAYTVTASLISIACLITLWNYKKYRYIFILLTIASVASLILSYSRGSYLACLAGLFVIFLKFNKSSKLILPALLFLTITMFNLPKSVEERFSSITASEENRDESAQSRFIFWEIAFERFQDKPIFGYGYKTVTDPRINPYEMDTHNYFVKVLVERGIIGFFILLALLYSVWKMTKKCVNWNRDDHLVNGIVLGMHGVIVALLVGNMFGDRFTHYPIMTIFWCYVGLISIYPFISEKKTDDAVKS